MNIRQLIVLFACTTIALVTFPSRQTVVCTTAAIFIYAGKYFWRIDRATFRLPNRDVFLFATSIVAHSILVSRVLHHILLALLSAFLLVLILGTISLAIPGSIGMGDVKLLFPLSLGLAMFNTEYIAICLLVSFTSAGLVSIATVMNNRETLSGRLAFAPYLFAGAFTCLLVELLRINLE